MSNYLEKVIDDIKTELQENGGLFGLDLEEDTHEQTAERIFNYAMWCDRIIEPLETEEEAAEIVLSNLSDVTELYLENDPNHGKERLADDLKAGKYLYIDSECRQTALVVASAMVATELLNK